MYRNIREQSEMSQETVAMMVPCSRDTIIRIESRKTTPTPEFAKRLAEIFDSPEFEAWYCYAECVLGKDICNQIEKIPLTDAVLEVQHALAEAQDLRPLVKIARDRMITHDEIPEAVGQTKALLRLGKAIDLFKLAMSDALNIKDLVKEINNEKHDSSRQARNRVV